MATDPYSGLPDNAINNEYLASMYEAASYYPEPYNNTVRQFFDTNKDAAALFAKREFLKKQVASGNQSSVPELKQTEVDFENKYPNFTTDFAKIAPDIGGVASDISGLIGFVGLALGASALLGAGGGAAAGGGAGATTGGTAGGGITAGEVGQGAVAGGGLLGGGGNQPLPEGGMVNTGATPPLPTGQTGSDGGSLFGDIGNWLGSGNNLGNLLNLGGGLLQGQQNTEAAQIYANAQLEAAKLAAEEARFRPVGVTTRFGQSRFGYDDKGRLVSAGYTLSPEMKAQQDALMGAITGKPVSATQYPTVSPSQGMLQQPTSVPTIQQTVSPQGMMYAGGSPSFYSKPAVTTQPITAKPITAQPKPITPTAPVAPVASAPAITQEWLSNIQSTRPNAYKAFQKYQDLKTAESMGLQGFNPQDLIAAEQDLIQNYPRTWTESGRTPTIAGARANGGPVIGGQTYLVGENGPEPFNTPYGTTMVGQNGPSLMTPATSGWVSPNPNNVYAGGSPGFYSGGQSGVTNQQLTSFPNTSGGLLGQAVNAQQTTAPLSTGAQSLFNLGQGYLGTSPQAQAVKYMQEQQALLAPSRERSLAQLQNQMYQQGRTGLAVGGTSTMGATNPELEAYLNAQRMQDLALAAQSTQGGQQYAQFGAGLLGTGGEMLQGMYGTQTAAYQPYQTALGMVTGIENLGQGAMDLGTSLGAKSATAGGNAGQFLQKGANAAAQQQLKANQYNPWVGLLQGAANWY